jgi:hypothetical protein
MVQALFGEAKGVLGKSFILTGLMPAGLLLVSLTAFFNHVAGLEALLTNVQSIEKSTTLAGAFVIGGWFALGLWFFASRSFFIEVFKDLPGAPLSWLRWRMIDRQTKRARLAKQAKESAMLDYTVLVWYQNHFEKPKAVLESLTVEREAILNESNAARALIERSSADSSDVDVRKTVQQVTTALRHLHGLSARADAEDIELFAEIAAWNSFVNDASVVQYLSAAAEDAYRRYVSAFIQGARFPKSDLWIQATAFGNRLAALDDYAESRYKINTTTLWRRLWTILPERSKAEMSDVRTTLEVLVNLTVAGILAAIVASCSTILQTALLLFRIGWSYADPISPLSKQLQPNWFAIIFIFTSIIFSFATYRSAVYSCNSLTEDIVRFIDLYRLKFLVALGFKCPAAVEGELNLFNQLNKFFTQAVPRDPKQELQCPMERDTEAARAQSLSGNEEVAAEKISNPDSRSNRRSQ